MKPDKIEKEWENAKKQFSPTSLSNLDKNGRPLVIRYDEETGRPTFIYRHPNFPLALSIISLLLVVGKPVLSDMLQWLLELLSR